MPLQGRRFLILFCGECVDRLLASRAPRSIDEAGIKAFEGERELQDAFFVAGQGTRIKFLRKKVVILSTSAGGEA
jgi:hypothetical protein